MMDRFAFRVLIAALASVVGLHSVAVGDIIYTLQNHPAFQNGHSLSGTITTTDTAPDDGLLMAAEIVDWSYSVTGPNSFSGTKSASSPAEVFGSVSISPTAITMPFPLVDPSSNELSLIQSTGGPSLRYYQVLDLVDPMGAGVFGGYEAAISTPLPESWQTSPDETGLGDPWLIARAATAVPEPGPVAAWCVATLATLGWRLRRNKTQALDSNR